ncbi:MAG: ATP-binding cassette domain-containing protein [Candidatus Altimarinota bacterium]
MLQLKNLTLYREGKAICRDLFFDVPKGSCFLIRGKNASGKSSLMSCIIGQLSPTSGQVLLDHHDVHRFEKKERKMFFDHSGIVLQQESLRPFDTVSSVLSSFDKKESADLLASFRLPSSCLVHELSFSQRRILELMASVLKHPKLLFWDEPFLGLDQESQEKWKSILLQQKQEGVTVVIATHSRNLFHFLSPEKILEL